MIRLLIDTNVCIDLIRGRAPDGLEILRQYQMHEVAISMITMAELEHGVNRSDRKARSRRLLYEFLMPILIMPFNHDAAAVYGQVRTDLERRGEPIGPLDFLIAAHALALDVPLMTGNMNEFSRVSGLTLHQWVR